MQSRGLGRQHLFHYLDEVGSQHGLHVDIGIFAQCIEFVTRHGVASERSNFSFGFESEPHRRGNGAVVGVANYHSHIADVECVAR